MDEGFFKLFLPDLLKYCFDLSCLILEKDIFIENLYIVLSCLVLYSKKIYLLKICILYCLVLYLKKIYLSCILYCLIK